MKSIGGAASVRIAKVARQGIQMFDFEEALTKVKSAMAEYLNFHEL